MSSTVEGSGAGRADGGLGTPRTSEGCKRREEELCRVGSQSFPTWAPDREGAGTQDMEVRVRLSSFGEINTSLFLRVLSRHREFIMHSCGLYSPPLSAPRCSEWFPACIPQGLAASQGWVSPPPPLEPCAHPLRPKAAELRRC